MIDGVGRWREERGGGGGKGVGDWVQKYMNTGLFDFLSLTQALLSVYYFISFIFVLDI